MGLSCEMLKTSQLALEQVSVRKAERIKNTLSQGKPIIKSTTFDKVYELDKPLRQSYKDNNSKLLNVEI